MEKIQIQDKHPGPKHCYQGLPAASYWQIQLLVFLSLLFTNNRHH
jgi:hypothetical protein